MAIPIEIGKPMSAGMNTTYPAHSSQRKPIASEMAVSERKLLPVTTTTVKAGHLICWRSIPLARRSRTTNVETAAKNKRASMMVWTGLKPLGRRSIPSGLRIDPRLPITPGETATQTAPAIVKNTLSHANHLQRLLGSRPLGNNKSESAIQPAYSIHAQEANQARASPAGSDLEAVMNFGSRTVASGHGYSKTI